MKSRVQVKILIDLLMTAALLAVSGYQFWGEGAHEWIGTGMFLLFIIHHLLNLNWHKNLFKGRYTLFRKCILIIDIGVFAAMVMQMYSGIVLSRHVFRFLSINNGLALARRLHILGAYWGYLLMSLHMGLHWNMVVGMVRGRIGLKGKSKTREVICFLAGGCIAVYGGYVFLKRDLVTYLFLRSEFVFLDYSESPFSFYIDYLALMGLCIFAAHYIPKLCRKVFTRKEGTI